MVALLFTDLVGSTWELHQVTNGLKDAREYAEAIRPKVFVPLHHDNAFPPLTADGRAWYDPLVAELERIPASQRPDLCFITDPDNYAAPLAFSTSEWAGTSKAVLAGCYRPA